MSSEQIPKFVICGCGQPAIFCQVERIGGQDIPQYQCLHCRIVFSGKALPKEPAPKNEQAKCPKCKGKIKERQELAALSDNGNFATYNYFWTCPCGYCDESVYGE